MERSKRKKLKRKMKILFILGYLIGIGLTGINVFIIFVILPNLGIIPLGDDASFFIVIGLLLSLLFPLFFGLLCGMIGSLCRADLLREKTRMTDERRMFHIGRCINKMKNKEIEEAINIYDEFIAGKGSVDGILVKGIILGYLSATNPEDKRINNTLKKYS